MNNSMDIKEMKRVIRSTPNLSKILQPEELQGEFEPSEFNREIIFESQGLEYLIEWWTNQSYLYICGVGPILFKRVELSSTWPNHAKNNLQFYQDSKTPCCIIEVDWYK